MNKITLAREIYQISNIKGNFTLRSQQQTTEYFDKYCSLLIAHCSLLNDAVSQLRELGATIEQAVCVIDRESLGAENLAKLGVNLMPLFTKSYLQSSSC